MISVSGQLFTTFNRLASEILMVFLTSGSRLWSIANSLVSLETNVCDVIAVPVMLSISTINYGMLQLSSSPLWHSLL